MNMKSKAGFTLVELIVVIAILAILAGVAIPAYTGYIAKAEQAAIMQGLSTVNTAVQGQAAVDVNVVDEIKVDFVPDIDSTTSGEQPGYTVEVDYTAGATQNYVDKSAEVAKLTGDLVTLFNSKDFTATWTKDSGKWTIN